MHIRPRRNRKSHAVRMHAQETHIQVNQLIYPLFLYDGKGMKEEVKSLPGNYRWSLDKLIPEVEACLELGITTFVLFPAVDEALKDKTASYGFAKDNFYLHAIHTLKNTFPACCIMTDVAMDPYSSDGHDGFVLDGQIMNDETLPILAKMAVAPHVFAWWHTVHAPACVCVCDLFQSLSLSPSLSVPVTHEHASCVLCPQPFCHKPSIHALALCGIAAPHEALSIAQACP